VSKGQQKDEDEYGLSAADLRQRIWSAEQSEEMTLEAFCQRLDQN